VLVASACVAIGGNGDDGEMTQKALYEVHRHIVLFPRILSLFGASDELLER
jgi:hypothetical protein